MDTMTVTAPSPLQARIADDSPRAAGNGTPFFGENGFGFEDILDAINPLQHIPVVSTIYRRLTGDEISTGARLAGGAVFGGPIGFVASLANAMIDDTTGHDVGEHVMAMVWPGRDAAPDAAPAFAQGEANLPNTQLASVPAAPASAPAEEASPAFLAALAPREQALAARESIAAARGPGTSTASTVPTLSPAAMEAIFAAVNMPGAAREDDEKEDPAAVSNLTQAPASFAAWQAATQNWAAAR